MTAIQQASPSSASNRQLSNARVTNNQDVQIFDRSLLSTGFWSLVAGLIPIIRVENLPGVGSFPVQRVQYVILLALILSAVLGKLARPRGLPVWLAAAVLVPLAGYISGFSSSVSASVTVALQFSVMCVLAPAVFRFHVLHSRRFLPCVLGVFLGTQTFSATVGLAQLAGTEVLGQEVVFGRSTGLAGHPNVLGIMSAIAVLTTLGILRGAGAVRKTVLWSVLIINAIALIATGSLSSILAAVVGIAVIAIGRRRLAAVILGAALAVVLFELGNLWVFSVLEYRLSVVTGESELGGAASIDVRFQTYQWALDYISRDPIFGVGMDDMNAATFNGVNEVHNYLLHAWYQGGLTLFIWFTGVTIVLLISIARALRTREGVGAAAVVAALVVFASTSSFFLHQQYWLPLLLAVAALPTNEAVRPKSISFASPLTPASGR